GTSVVVVIVSAGRRPCNGVQVWNSRPQQFNHGVGARREVRGALVSCNGGAYLMRPASLSVFSWKLATLSIVVLASCCPVTALVYSSCCSVRSSKNSGMCQKSLCQSRLSAQARFHGRKVT